MIKKLDCTLLINSCDKYVDILDTFFELLHRFWPDLPFEIALTTETLEYKSPYFNIKNIHPKKKTCSWTERMKDALNDITSNYILLMLDDFFLYDYVQTEKVLENLEVLKKNPNIVNFTYWPILNDTEESIYPGFKKRTKNARYKVAAITSLWNKKQFLKYVTGYKENIWEFEPNATKRSNTIYQDDEFYVSKDFPVQIFPYDFTKYGLFSGKWFKENKALFKKLGIKMNFHKRGFYNSKNRGLTQSFISSFKLESYIVPKYSLEKDNPIKKHKIQKPGDFTQKYQIKGAHDIIYWCLTDQCGFAVKNLKIEVEYENGEVEQIDNNLLFGSFKKQGNLLVFNAGMPHVYIKTAKDKKINTIEINGTVVVPVSKFKLQRAYNYITKPKTSALQSLKYDSDKEILLVNEIMSYITIYPKMHYYIKDKYSEDEILEFSEKNTKETFAYTFYVKENVTSVEWCPSLNGGYAIKNLTITYKTEDNKIRKVPLKKVEGLPRYVNDKYIFLEGNKIRINLPQEKIIEIIIKGVIEYPIEKEILAYLLNDKKTSKIREGK